MRYHMRTGIDHEYKRKAITALVLAAASIVILTLTANLLLNLRVTRLQGDTMLTRAQRDTRTTDQNKSSENSGETQAGSVGNSNTNAKQSPSRQSLTPLANSSLAQPTATPTVQSVPAITSPLPVGGIGGGGLHSCGCGTVVPAPTPIVTPVLETVESATRNTLDVVDSAASPVTSLLH